MEKIIENMQQIKTDGYFTKMYHGIKKINITNPSFILNKKTGETKIVHQKFTTDRKLVLSNLIQKYENLYNSKGYTNPHLRREEAYHFYFQQIDLAEDLNMTDRGIRKIMSFLQEQGYLKYFSTNKEGYIYRATYVLMNVDFINKKIEEANNIPTQKTNKEKMEQPIAIAANAEKMEEPKVEIVEEEDDFDEVPPEVEEPIEIPTNAEKKEEMKVEITQKKQTTEEIYIKLYNGTIAFEAMCEILRDKRRQRRQLTETANDKLKTKIREYCENYDVLMQLYDGDDADWSTIFDLLEKASKIFKDRYGDKKHKELNCFTEFISFQEEEEEKIKIAANVERPIIVDPKRDEQYINSSHTKDFGEMQ
jgi:hypothetical protein